MPSRHTMTFDGDTSRWMIWRALAVGVDEVVRVAEAVAHVARDGERAADRHALPARRHRRAQLRQVAPRQVLHRQVGDAVDDAEVVDLHDVGMGELRHQARLGSRTWRRTRAATVSAGSIALTTTVLVEAARAVAGRLVDDRHAALAHAFGEQVRAELNRRVAGGCGEEHGPLFLHGRAIASPVPSVRTLTLRAVYNFKSPSRVGPPSPIRGLRRRAPRACFRISRGLGTHMSAPFPTAPNLTTRVVAGTVRPCGARGRCCSSRPLHRRSAAAGTRRRRHRRRQLVRRGPSVRFALSRALRPHRAARADQARARGAVTDAGVDRRRCAICSTRRRATR